MAHAQAMIEGKITNPMRVLKDDPAGIAETAWTAEAAWPGAEFPTAEAKTAAGTEASSNVEICLENDDIGAEIDPKINAKRDSATLRGTRGGGKRNKPLLESL